MIGLLINFSDDHDDLKYIQYSSGEYDTFQVHVAFDKLVISG